MASLTKAINKDLFDSILPTFYARQLLNDEQYFEALEEFGDDFDARMGAEAVRELLVQRGFATVESRRDLGGHQRISLGQWPL